ncbi:MAG: DNA internalization-related competence protein ComEC/Rec2 [bacterium]|nr:DNA internalization-related competence protein ComEC/Rec2 [bacterium]
MSRRPLVPLAIFLILGILVRIPDAFLILLLTWLLLLLLRKNFILYLCFIAIGSLLAELHSYSESNHIRSFCEKKGELIGTISSYPLIYPDRTYFILSAEKFDNNKVSGLIAVSLPHSNYSYSERIRLNGVRIKEKKPFNNPGAFRKSYDKIDHRIFVWNRDQIERLGKGKANPFLFLAYQIREKAEFIIKETMAVPYSSFLMGVVLGDDSEIPEELKDAFVETGTIHIMVVSGLNLVILAWFFFVLFKAVGLGRKSSGIIIAALLFFFTLVTGASPPVLRAFVMVAAYLFSCILDRDIDPINSLALSAIILLFLDPFSLFNIGFQLSFAACLSIITFIQNLPKIGFLFDIIFVSPVAWLGTFPLILFYFGRMTISGILANILIIPLISIILPGGLILVLVGFISLGLAKIIGLILFCPAWLLLKIVLIGKMLPLSSVILPHPSIPSVIFIYLFIFMLAVGLWRRIALIGCLILANLIIWNYALAKPEFEMTFLDGNSIFIQFPCGNMLVDAGNEHYGKSGLVPFLRYKGIDRLNLVVATHSDINHIGGFAPLMRLVKIDRIILSNQFKDREFIDSIKDLEIIRVAYGDRIRFGEAKIKILNPSTKHKDENNNSIVMRIELGKFSALLTGDIKKEAEAMLLGDNIASTLLCAPNHGGKTSYLPCFIKKVCPKIVIVQGGKDEVYQNALYTKKEGAITIKINEKGYRIESYEKVK